MNDQAAAPTSAPIPTGIKLHRKARVLEVSYADGTAYQLPAEYLRVYSPSAEVRGHGGGEPMLLGGKREVNIDAIEPIGRYAVRLKFSDGHNTGLYTWPVFQELGSQYEALWTRYLQRLEEHGMTRDSVVVKLSALHPKTPRP
jgi:DUF971 family protein